MNVYYASPTDRPTSKFFCVSDSGRSDRPTRRAQRGENFWVGRVRPTDPICLKFQGRTRPTDRPPRQRGGGRPENNQLRTATASAEDFNPNHLTLKNRSRAQHIGLLSSGDRSEAGGPVRWAVRGRTGSPEILVPFKGTREGKRKGLL